MLLFQTEIENIDAEVAQLQELIAEKIRHQKQLKTSQKEAKKALDILQNVVKEISDPAILSDFRATVLGLFDTIKNSSEESVASTLTTTLTKPEVEVQSEVDVKAKLEVKPEINLNNVGIAESKKSGRKGKKEQIISTTDPNSFHSNGLKEVEKKGTGNRGKKEQILSPTHTTPQLPTALPLFEPKQNNLLVNDVTENLRHSQNNVSETGVKPSHSQNNLSETIANHSIPHNNVSAADANHSPSQNNLSTPNANHSTSQDNLSTPDVNHSHSHNNLSSGDVAVLSIDNKADAYGVKPIVPDTTNAPKPASSKPKQLAPGDIIGSRIVPDWNYQIIEIKSNNKLQCQRRLSSGESFTVELDISDVYLIEKASKSQKDNPIQSETGVNIAEENTTVDEKQTCPIEIENVLKLEDCLEAETIVHSEREQADIQLSSTTPETLAKLIREAKNWSEIETVVAANEQHKKAAWTLLSKEEQNQVLVLKLQAEENEF